MKTKHNGPRDAQAAAHTSAIPGASCTAMQPPAGTDFDACVFDYNDTPPSVATFLKGQADRIRKYTAKCIITIGKDLIAAKHYLSHGAFIRWVESEVGIPARTAQGYMKVAEWAADKCADVAQLPPSVLYILSRSRTPKEFADSIFRRLEAGERIVLSDLRGELRLLLAHRDGAQVVAGNRESTNAGVEPEIIGPDLEAHPSLKEAISILLRNLPREDFARVREIMTNDGLVCRPDLGHHIVHAFLAVDYADEDALLGEDAEPSSDRAPPSDRPRDRTAPVTV
jgi:Protein of unknown function (DUF3102)